MELGLWGGETELVLASSPPVGWLLSYSTAPISGDARAMVVQRILPVAKHTLLGSLRAVSSSKSGEKSAKKHFWKTAAGPHPLDRAPMVLTSPLKKPEDLGFYMPDSPFAKIAEEDGLDFNSDKGFKKAELSMAQQENDVVADHHVGRRWAEKLALMTRHTGAFRELEGVTKTPYGGVDEDGVDLWIPDAQIQEAKETAKMKMRVLARKYAGKPEMMKAEQAKVSEELWAKIGKPNLPRARDKNGKLASPTNIMASL